MEDIMVLIISIIYIIQDGDQMEDSRVLLIVNNMQDIIWTYMDYDRTFKGIWGFNNKLHKLH